MQYAPMPIDGERQAASLCMAKGIGEVTASALMAEYGSISNLCTASLEDLSNFRIDNQRYGDGPRSKLAVYYDKNKYLMRSEIKFVNSQFTC